MGNGLQKNHNNNANFSTKVYMSDSVFLKKSFVQPNNHVVKTPEKLMLSNPKPKMEESGNQMKILTDFTILDGLKKGKKLSILLNFAQFSQPINNLDLILALSQKIKEVTEKLSLSGLISNALAKQYAEIIAKVDKSFKNKLSVIDLSGEVNQKRLISVLKLMVHVLNSARFFKEDAGFAEGKWWKMRDEKFLHSLERKINKKCEAILENYENTDEDEESFANSTSVDDKLTKKSGIEQRKSQEKMEYHREIKAKNPSILRNNNSSEKKTTFNSAGSPNIVIKPEQEKKNSTVEQNNQEHQSDQDSNIEQKGKENISDNKEEFKESKKEESKNQGIIEQSPIKKDIFVFKIDNDGDNHYNNGNKESEMIPISSETRNKITKNKEAIPFFGKDKDNSQMESSQKKNEKSGIQTNDTNNNATLRAELGKHFLSEIKEFKKNLKALLNDNNAAETREDETLRGFIRKYLQKTYDNVCEI